MKVTSHAARGRAVEECVEEPVHVIRQMLHQCEWVTTVAREATALPALRHRAALVLLSDRHLLAFARAAVQTASFSVLFFLRARRVLLNGFLFSHDSSPS